MVPTVSRPEHGKFAEKRETTLRDMIPRLGGENCGLKGYTANDAGLQTDTGARNARL